MRKFDKKHIGFTLAEILVTLGVIGVIASMTVPTLVQDIQDAQFHSAWKKAYADLDQATKRVLSDNGGSLKGLFPNSNILRDKYLAYLNYTKQCDMGKNSGNCWNTLGGLKPNGRPYPDDGINTEEEWWFKYTAGAILNNGYNLIFMHTAVSCTYSTEVSCGRVLVDVNGFKGPNQIGKDIYGAFVRENGMKPRGFEESSQASSCATSHGWACSALYLYQ